MTRKRTHRKYRPADPTSWAYAIARQWDMDPAEATKIMVKLRVAYQRMREGNGDAGDFDTMASALNIGLMRAARIGEPLAAGIRAGMDALLEADRGDRYAFTGPGILAMNCAIDLYDEILRKSTPLQMQQAVQDCDELWRAGQIRQTGKVTP